MDRRIQKTRQALQAALLELLLEKPLEKIEIQEITDRANSARVTFYRHYGTKEELLLDTIEQVYAEFERRFAMPSLEQVLDFSQQPPVYAVYQMFQEKRVLYKKLFTGTVSALIQQRLRHYIVQQVTQTFSAAPNYANLPLFLIANHIASVVIGNIMWWLADDLPYSIEYMAQVTHWMSMSGALALVGRSGEIHPPSAQDWRIISG